MNNQVRSCIYVQCLNVSIKYRNKDYIRRHSSLYCGIYKSGVDSKFIATIETGHIVPVQNANYCLNPP